MNKIAYVFDVDGTLTPSRLTMKKKFQEFFLKWMEGKNIFFITGSDKDKTIEQVGSQIWSRTTSNLQSCGNNIWEGDEEVHRLEWSPNAELITRLRAILNESKYPIRTSNHIEERIGLVNFSIVGRGCTQEQRDAYYEWDTKEGERLRISQALMKQFPQLEASVGGQISIDIHPKGCNKSQAKKWILDKLGEDTTIYFYGDKTLKGGNDYDLAKILESPHRVFPVKDWNDTMNLLLKI